MAGVPGKLVAEFRELLWPVLWDLNDFVKVLPDPVYRQWTMTDEEVEVLQAKITADHKTAAGKKVDAYEEFSRTSNEFCQNVKTWHRHRAAHHWICFGLTKHNSFVPRVSEGQFTAELAKEHDEMASEMPSANRKIAPLKKKKKVEVETETLSELDKELLDLTDAAPGYNADNYTSPLPTTSEASPSQAQGPATAADAQSKSSFPFDTTVPLLASASQPSPVVSQNASTQVSFPAESSFSSPHPPPPSPPTDNPALVAQLAALEARVRDLESLNVGLSAENQQYQQEAVQQQQQHQQQQQDLQRQAQEKMDEIQGVLIATQTAGRTIEHRLEMAETAQSALQEQCHALSRQLVEAQQHAVSAQTELQSTEAARRALQEQCQKLSTQVDHQLATEKEVAARGAADRLAMIERHREELLKMSKVNGALAAENLGIRMKLEEAEAAGPAVDQTFTAPLQEAAPVDEAPAPPPPQEAPAFPYRRILESVRTRPAIMNPKGRFQAAGYDYEALPGEIRRHLSSTSPPSLEKRLERFLTFISWVEDPRQQRRELRDLESIAIEVHWNVEAVLKSPEQWSDETTLVGLETQIGAVEAATAAYDVCFADFWAPDCKLGHVPAPIPGMPVDLRVVLARKGLRELQTTFEALVELDEKFGVGPQPWRFENPFKRFLDAEVGKVEVRLKAYEIPPRPRPSVRPAENDPRRIRLPPLPPLPTFPSPSPPPASRRFRPAPAPRRLTRVSSPPPPPPPHRVHFAPSPSPREASSRLVSPPPPSRRPSPPSFPSAEAPSSAPAVTERVSYAAVTTALGFVSLLVLHWVCSFYVS
ncbi:unnamed protein product [Periconia digitata]|uniref:Uncharacterized protein n=1 Tax=Periconia digitata TaxID=1303443 RepID=A0A9W4XRQ7_9PLEO|nr:unnamed protein product [Periconia digitata]